jgi:uncharacterized protein (TIGR02145 family)
MKNIFFLYIGLLMVNITFAQSTNVGIGTTNPTAKLHVAGSIKVVDGTQGAGKVLTSDATGKGSWQTLALPPSDPNSDSSYTGTSIGCMTWMTKNLDVTHYRNGDSIPQVTSGPAWAALTTGAFCYYSNDPDSIGAIYGILYNWYAVNDPRGLAPEGWHVASDYEWTTLVNTLGGSHAAGGPLKELGVTKWTGPNLGATNLCNFAALPGGYRGVQGGFNVLGDYGHWWTCTMAQTDLAWSRNMNYTDKQVLGAGSDWNNGYSVRCVKD